MENLYFNSIKQLKTANTSKQEILLVHIGLIILSALGVMLLIEFVQVELFDQYFFSILKTYQAWGMFFFGAWFTYKGISPWLTHNRHRTYIKALHFIALPLMAISTFILDVIIGTILAMLGSGNRNHNDSEPERNAADKIWWGSEDYYSNDAPDR